MSVRITTEQARELAQQLLDIRDNLLTLAGERDLYEQSAHTFLIQRNELRLQLEEMERDRETTKRECEVWLQERDEVKARLAELEKS